MYFLYDIKFKKNFKNYIQKNNYQNLKIYNFEIIKKTQIIFLYKNIAIPITKLK